jgi:hypothetical protein
VRMDVSRRRCLGRVHGARKTTFLTQWSHGMATARRQHIEQLRRIARPPKQIKHDDDALLMSILAGFPDRVTRRGAGNQVILSKGVSAEIAGEPSP